jgi:predicted amidohydrolase
MTLEGGASRHNDVPPSETRPISVALLQRCLTRREAEDRSFDALLDALDRAATANDLVLLPELWATGYFAFDDYAAQADSLQGPIVDAISDIARRRGAHVMGGSLVERTDAGLYNTAVLVDPDGNLALTYRKTHLFGLRSSREGELLLPGDEIRAVDSALGRIGVMTCYDLRFPEVARRLMEDGATTILVVAAWPASRVEHWRLLLRARALENQLFVIACNGAGDGGGVPLGGHSAVVDPYGAVVVELEGSPGRVDVTLDLGDVERARCDFPVLADRRFDLAPTLAPTVPRA